MQLTDKRNTIIIAKKVLLLLFLLAVMSCSHQKKQYVIAVSSCSNDMWREKLNEELTVSTYLYDNVRLIIQSANDDDKRQIEQINHFVDNGVDLLIVSPNQLKTISSAINRAYERHIPVVLFDRKTDTDKYTAYIGADNKKVGRDMGEYVAKLMKGHGKLVVINGLESSSPAIERNAGFMEVIKRYPDIKIVGSAYAGWFYEEAVVRMDSILNHTTDIDCVFAQNDRMALGARKAVEARGLKRHIDFVGVDALPVKGGGLESVESGLLTASYIYPTRGDLVIALAMNILQGKPYKRDNSLYGALVTKDNASVLLLQNEELTKQRDRLHTIHDKVDFYLAHYSHQRVYTMLAMVICVLLIVLFVSIYSLILARRRKEEEETDAKLVFFTNLSHEFRTPLTLISDPVDRLLTDETLNKEQHSLLRLVRKNVEVMLRLVNEILDFRKVQKGKMTMRLVRFDLAESIKQWAEDFLPATTQKQITLTTDTGEAAIEVIADREKIERVVYNLLSNAVKYTPQGGHIALSATKQGDDAEIKINDSGNGMSQDELRHVFDRFYQANSSVGGTGIGLSLVKAFVEMHHGTVKAESTVGKGSIFTVCIPLKQEGEVVSTLSADTDTTKRTGNNVATLTENVLPTAAEPTHFDRITAPDTSQEQKPIVLVIDDSDDVRAYIVSLLRSDYNVIQAADGNEGLRRATEEVPDIVVCDVMMPGIDGLEVCQHMKNETATSHIPVILLTARNMEEQRIEGYDCGADAYITKPFNGKVLLSRIRNLLDTRSRLKAVYGSNDLLDIRKDDADSLFINNFNGYVVANLANSELSVEDVSAALGLSRVQMYRKVKALTGHSPVKLIRTTRLKRAEQLLKRSNKTVAEVCYEVGFNNPSYFSKCFKEEFGHLPSE